MRIVRVALPVALAAALSACASGAGPSSYQSELEELAAACEARGGVLSPTGRQSGRPQVDNVCKISG